MTPAKITLPAVGASVCASGNQVWKGKLGTLKAKPRKKPQKAKLVKSKARSAGKSAKGCAAAAPMMCRARRGRAWTQEES